MLVGLNPIQPNRRNLIEDPLPNKEGWKKLAKCEVGEFTSIGKQTQLLFIECIWQSQKFKKS